MKPKVSAILFPVLMGNVPLIAYGLMIFELLYKLESVSSEW